MDLHTGGVAQMVERSLSMREVPGSIHGASKELFFVSFFCFSNFKMFIEIKVFLQVTHSLSSKTKGCIVRESNPGRPRGRRAFYHWTNDAADIGGGPKVSNWACHLTFSPRTSKTVNFHIYHLSFLSCHWKQKSCVNVENNCCNVRESNPGRPRGRRAFYHWTNVAGMLFGYSYNPTPCWKSLFRNLSIYNPNTDWYSFTPERLIWLAVSRLWQ